MEIVVNKCFGGFGLSVKALQMLSEKGIPTYNNWEELKQHTSDVVPWIILVGDTSSYMDNYSNFSEHRTHPFLIEVIKALGDEANGMCADLVIVDIPDDIDWEIDDYDGIETIHEKHRSW